MTADPDATARRARRGHSVADVAAFYDEWTDRFVAGFGSTLQAGLLRAEASTREDPDESNVLLGHRAGLRDGDLILDAGCGVGGPAAAVARALPTSRVVGVTISRLQANRARSVIAEAGVTGRVSVLHGDYHDLGLRDGQFDAVLFLESCGYSADHDRLFTEAARVVRPGGTIYVKDVFAREGPLTATQRADLDRFDELWRLARSPTLSGVTRSLVRAGCEIVAAAELEHVGTATYLAAMIEPDPETLFRLNELGQHFAMRADDVALMFAEVVARVS